MQSIQTQMQKPITELDFGHNDATAYLNGKERDLFNRLFFKTPYIEKVQDPNRYFIVGEKGTGKTAFAVYVSNNNIPETSGRIAEISSTEYKKFVELKRRDKLEYSDFPAIWRVILLLLLSQKVRDDLHILEKAGSPLAFRHLCTAIDDFYANAFNPEFEQAFQIVSSNTDAIKVMAKYFEVKDEAKLEVSEDNRRTKLNLMQLEKTFKDALRNVSVKKKHMLFIDGIDQRPADIPYLEYVNCIAGLMQAIWQLNNDFISSERRLRGRIRIMGLCRPDIMYRSGLQNVTAKLLDNSVVLEWATVSAEYKSSLIYLFCRHLLSYDQPTERQHHNWLVNYWNSRRSEQELFSDLLRMTWHRPRDFVTLFRFLQLNRNRGAFAHNSFQFDLKELEHPSFTRDYSTYMLGEVRDYSMYYMSNDHFDEMLTFFQRLDGRSAFDYHFYVNAHADFIQRTKKHGGTIRLLSDEETFLQYLYDCNIVCCEEKTETGETFIHWSFRERSAAEVYPKIKLGAKYSIHKGIAKALNIGKAMVEMPSPRLKNQGTRSQRRKYR